MADRPRGKGVVAQLGGPLGVAVLAIGGAALAAYALDLHKHQCSSCGHVWRHFGAFNLGDEPAHTCGSCGQIQWWKDGWAQYAATGRMTDGAFPRTTSAQPPSQSPPMAPLPSLEDFLTSMKGQGG